MNYQVLARKWRPKNFSELAGQEHVQRALINALDNDRLHHAFLFTGTRGVGKTTIARILAKSLNCETGITATPCGTCSACVEINEGRFIDLIEVDAASKTKVEDTRELLENVQYSPTRGRYKVYLIDEVHMLSTHSFNALLKTLEEPPPHVKFLLATTDPQKLPVTILSRCLQFNLKRLPVELIRDYLDKVLKEEGIEFEPDATLLLAESADGSMRDALSLLDQAIAYGGGNLQEKEVRDMLGTVDKKIIFGLVKSLSDYNAPALIQQVSELASQSPNFSSVLDELLTILHHVALAQVAPEAVNSSNSNADIIAEIAAKISPEETQLFYQIALIGKRDLFLAPTPALGLEMTLLRMLAFQPGTGVTSPGIPAASSSTISSSTTVSTTPKPGNEHPAKSSIAPSPLPLPANENPANTGGEKNQVNEESGNRTTNLEAISKTLKQAKTKKKLSDQQNNEMPGNISQPPTAKSPVEQSPVSQPVNNLRMPENAGDWESLVNQIPVSGLTLELAKNCEFIEFRNDQILLAILESHKQLIGDQRQSALQDAIASLSGQKVKLSISIMPEISDTPAIRETRRRNNRQKQAIQSINDDPVVKSILDTFDARINPKTIEPVDN